jgi:hypothetical protein
MPGDWRSLLPPKNRKPFLDNSVEIGSYPSIIARGTQSQMDIFNPIAFVDIERYQKINIMAHSPETVYPDQAVLEIAKNIGFLQLCIKKIEHLRFVDLDSDQEYLAVKNGKFTIIDPDLLRAKLLDDDLKSIFLAIAPEICNIDAPAD